MKTCGGSGCIDPRFLDLGTSWSWVVNFTPRQLYPPAPIVYEARWVPEQVLAAWRGEDLAPTGTRTPIPRPSSPQPVATPTALSRLPTLLLIKIKRKSNYHNERRRFDGQETFHLNWFLFSFVQTPSLNMSYTKKMGQWKGIWLIYGTKFLYRNFPSECTFK
jgi:hypothetical protein